MRTSKISAIAHALPICKVTQSELVEKFGEKAIKSITRMSGIKERRVVEPGQTAADLAFAAAERLIVDKNIDRLKIDVLIFASQTPDYKIPATAAVLHGKLGLSEKCSAFDISQACPSFLHATQVAHAMIVSDVAQKVLVLNGDALSTLINPLDRGLVTLHGDAGTAALFEPADSEDGGIDYISIGTDGTNFDRIIIPAGASRTPSTEDTRQEATDAEGCVRNAEQLFMDGPAIFHFVIYKMAEVLKSALEEMKRTIDDYDHVIFHQANKTMLDLLYQSLAVPAEKRFYYHSEVGNASGASTPMTLSEAWRKGFIKPGTRSLICAFGGGLSWGVLSLKWPENVEVRVLGTVDTPKI